MTIQFCGKLDCLGNFCLQWVFSFFKLAVFCFFMNFKTYIVLLCLMCSFILIQFVFSDVFLDFFSIDRFCVQIFFLAVRLLYMVLVLFFLLC